MVLAGIHTSKDHYTKASGELTRIVLSRELQRSTSHSARPRTGMLGLEREGSFDTGTKAGFGIHAKARYIDWIWFRSGS